MEQQQTWRRELPNYKQVTPEIEDLPFQAREAINALRGNIQLSGANLKVIASRVRSQMRESPRLHSG